MEKLGEIHLHKNISKIKVSFRRFRFNIFDLKNEVRALCKKLYYRLLPTGLENKNDIVVIEQ